MNKRQITSVRERFERHYILEPNSGCWLWVGGVQSGGYGIFYSGSGRSDRRSTTAHRIAYELFVGSIPEGFDVDHLCRVRCCVNPDHLEAISHGENLLRSPCTFSGIHSQKTHCPKGHPYTGNNLYVDARTGYRQCNICRSNHNRNRRRKT